MRRTRGILCHVNPSREEVCVRAIPELPSGKWRLVGPDEEHIGGAAPKDLLTSGIDKFAGPAFIAKRPSFKPKEDGNEADSRRPSYRECVSEEIISRIGRSLPLVIADSHLVRLPQRLSRKRGGPDPDVRFLSRFFLRRGEMLIHGVEIVARYLQADREEVQQVFNLKDKREERNFYTVDFVLDTLSALVNNDERQYLGLADSFARLLAFDALVGAQDRHAENWGVIENVVDPNVQPRFAPIYDTARGLFATHSEQELVQQLEKRGREGLVQNYAEKSRPLFGCKETRQDATINHFALLKACLRDHDELRRGVREVVFAFSSHRVHEMLIRRFRRIITELRLGLIVDLLRFRHERLKLLVREPTLVKR